ncbi:hypothetical protein Asru_0420_01 [Acidisphaera rubrifaciens HS-AP3]|uniref:Uncharacterized protein n=2 Tax=Acidisphaera TaxID=50714 RepID=A0A0D6PA01_9PROT|nr:hypothetical protein Asru_0420_01 [Acidisphaera rubrifaciens HS-AP3]
MAQMAVTVLLEADYALIRSKIPGLPDQFKKWEFQTWQTKARIEGGGHVADEITVTLDDVVSNRITTIDGLESFARQKLMSR